MAKAIAAGVLTLLLCLSTTRAAYVKTAYSSICVLKPTDNNNDPYLHGTVLFEQLADTNLLVTINVTGLSNGEHGYHVHTYGDISSNDGMATGGHFVGDCDNCRPANKPQEVGLLNNGTLLASAGGEANFQYVEYVAKLAGTNSIEGRAIIIHGNEVSASTRVAQCVIGRRTGDLASPILRPTVSHATCTLAKTSSSPTAISGKITLDDDGSGNGILVKWDVTGLVAGMTHGFHVHTWGDISNPNGMSVAGHFIGNCNGDCRPSGVVQEVGMLFDGAGITVPAGATSVVGSNTDTVIRLSGVDNVVGRALIIHGDSSSTGVRVAQCVIGQAAVPELPPAAPKDGLPTWAVVLGIVIAVIGVGFIGLMVCCRLCRGSRAGAFGPKSGRAQDIYPDDGVEMQATPAGGAAVVATGEAEGAGGARVRTNPVHAQAPDALPLAKDRV